jgi:hypothetical protein
MAIDILKQIYSGTGSEVPVVGWELNNPDIEQGYMRIYHFSSAALAGKCLGINNSHIGSVCRGERKSAGGWCFKFKSEYEEEERYTFDPNSPKFEIIDISNGKKGDASTNGDVQ